MSFTAEQINEMVVSTQKNLGRMKWTDLKHDLQDFVVMPQILKKERIMFDGGTGSRFQLQTDFSGTYNHSGLFDTDVTGQNDTLTYGEIPWRHVYASYSYDERQPEMNSGAEKIVDFIKAQRCATLARMCEGFETDFFSKPVDSTDNTTPWGLPMFVVKSASTPAFNGGNPSGYTSGYAGVSSSTVTRWKNWSGAYTAVTELDLIDKMEEAADKTHFKSPVANPTYDRADKRTIYTVYSVLKAMRKISKSQNDNLGFDLDPVDGNVRFRRIPVKWVPYLDADTSNPVYGLNWSSIVTIFLKGEYLKEMPPSRHMGSHRVKDVFIDCSFNWRCHNRRANWVLSV